MSETLKIFRTNVIKARHNCFIVSEAKLQIPYLIGYKTGFSLSRMTPNN